MKRLRGRRGILAVISGVLAAVIWLSLLPWLLDLKAPAFAAEEGGLSPRAEAMARRFLDLWADPEALDQSYAFLAPQNPEWDFMARTFLVLALVNLALREPERSSATLPVVDAIITDTLERERELGPEGFLLPYGRSRPFVDPAGRSLFVDGEIALMLGARRVLEEHPAWAREHRARVDSMVAQMERSPVLSGESYPDECWTFCNTTALAAIRMSDVLDGRDHGRLLSSWVSTAMASLVDPETGLLVSSYTRDGRVLDGPEGSSLWMTAHNLLLIEPGLARDQYERARAELVLSGCGFAAAREWPASWEGPADVDSGPIIPVLGISAGSSGLAILGAGAMGDEETLKGLLRSLELAGFPIWDEGRLSYGASNLVGDAVILYGLVQGPLWERFMAAGEDR